MVEMNGAVAIKTTITLRKCAKECSENDKCVTLFYNHNSGLCVIHSTDFKFQTPSLTELGWKHYVIRDGRSSFLADYRLRHLVNNVAMHIYTHD
jgi:hypothetical protein